MLRKRESTPILLGGERCRQRLLRFLYVEHCQRMAAGREGESKRTARSECNLKMRCQTLSELPAPPPPGKTDWPFALRQVQDVQDSPRRDDQPFGLAPFDCAQGRRDGRRKLNPPFQIRNPQFPIHPCQRAVCVVLLGAGGDE